MYLRNRTYLFSKASEIVNNYYQINHEFKFKCNYRGYDSSIGIDYICIKCKYELELSFWEEDEWINKENIKFYYESEKTNSFLNCTRLHYFGDSRILNDDKVDIISCNEYIIKTLLE